jgi:hypothetical protein
LVWVLVAMMHAATSDESIFVPRMPEVDQPANLGAVFERVRATAAAGAPGAGGVVRRCVAVVTPGRALVLQPCPAPGTQPVERVAAIEKMIPAAPQRNIAVIGYTELTAVKANIVKAIPFIGMLLGIAYIGHIVWVFEGHATALAEGCRNADALLVDSGMLPHLPADWQAVASTTMRRREIYVHDRATFRLVPAVRAAAA